MGDKNTNLSGSIYGVWKTDFGAWAIRTRNVTCYLLEGTERALLIDTAYGAGNLRAVVEKLVHLPLIVANTHGHYDHTGGNGFWPEVWMGPGGEAPAQSAKARKKLPFPNYRIQLLQDGQTFDLGGRSVRAIAIGAHHASSFAFLDEGGRTLYTGDEVEGGQVLLNVHGEKISHRAAVARHLKNMQKLKALAPGFDRLAPAHNGGPLAPEYIDDYICLAQGVLDGSIRPCASVAGYGMPPWLWGGNLRLARVEYGGASFVYAKE